MKAKEIIAIIFGLDAEELEFLNITMNNDIDKIVRCMEEYSQLQPNNQVSELIEKCEKELRELQTQKENSKNGFNQICLKSRIKDKENFIQDLKHIKL